MTQDMEESIGEHHGIQRSQVFCVCAVISICGVGDGVGHYGRSVHLKDVMKRYTSIRLFLSTLFLCKNNKTTLIVKGQ